MEIIIGIFLLISGFFIGACWMQIKETNFGKKANYICKNCDAIGCMSKFCELKRNKGE